MNKRRLRELLEAYAGRDQVYEHILQQMVDMSDCNLGELMAAATSDDGFKALAAINLLPMMYGANGISAVQVIAETWDGIGAAHARQMMELYAESKALEPAKTSSSAL
jgi:hypothetical protein